MIFKATHTTARLFFIFYLVSAGLGAKSCTRKSTTSSPGSNQRESPSRLHWLVSSHSEATSWRSSMHPNSVMSGKCRWRFAIIDTCNRAACISNDAVVIITSYSYWDQVSLLVQVSANSNTFLNHILRVLCQYESPIPAGAIGPTWFASGGRWNRSESPWPVCRSE